MRVVVRILHLQGAKASRFGEVGAFADESRPLVNVLRLCHTNDDCKSTSRGDERTSPPALYPELI